MQFQELAREGLDRRRGARRCVSRDTFEQRQDFHSTMNVNLQGRSIRSTLEQTEFDQAVLAGVLKVFVQKCGCG